MSIYFFILITLVVVGTFSLVLERRWNRRRTASTEETDATVALDSSLRALLNKGVAAIQAKLPLRQQEPALIDQFRTWSEEALAADSAVLGWLNVLSDPAYSAFVEHVAEFSDEMGFQLADLVNGQMACLPGITEHATEIVVHYCRANQRAAVAQDDFDEYSAYAAYLQAPNSTESEQFVQHLYTQLVEQQLVAAPTPELLGLSEKERLAQMRDDVHQATEQSEAFRVALRTVVAERRRTPEDFTVAKIVQRAMSRISNPPAEPSPVSPTDVQETPAVAEN